MSIATTPHLNFRGNARAARHARSCDCFHHGQSQRRLERRWCWRDAWRRRIAQRVEGDRKWRCRREIRRCRSRRKRNFVILNNRIGEQLLTHQIELTLQSRGVGAFDLKRDVFADARILHSGMPQLMERFFDRLTLRVEERGLERYMDFGKRHEGKRESELARETDAARRIVAKRATWGQFKRYR